MSDVALASVYDEPIHADVLWFLLAEREPWVNISHKKMPSWEEHVAFVAGRPYLEWWFILEADPKLNRASDSATFLGTCYVSKHNEIGIQIFKNQQRRGYASAALRLLIERHKGKRLLANIAPGNDASIELFYRHGFGLIQYTYELEAPR